MEFTIDFALVKKIASQEGAQARAEIAALGPQQAHRASLQRHDARLHEAADAGSLACQAGCAWCCHFSVDVRPVEVLNILEFIDRHFTPEQRARLRDELEINAGTLRSLDDVQRMQHNIKCPFLVDNRCSIYPARPQTCRNYHATDASGCQKSYEEPYNLDIEPDFAPLVYQSGAAQVEAFSEALSHAGYDVAAYELNAALLSAMTAPEGVRQRFDSRQTSFTALEGTEVPAEFLNLD